MTIDANTLVLFFGLLANLLVVVGYTNKLERRLTHVETLLNVLLRGLRIMPRVTDNVPRDGSDYQLDHGDK